MAAICRICTHPRRALIEIALLHGESERSIARKFSVTDSAVHRHKASSHSRVLLEQLIRAAAGLDLAPAPRQKKPIPKPPQPRKLDIFDEVLRELMSDLTEDPAAAML